MGPSATGGDGGVGGGGGGGVGGGKYLRCRVSLVTVDDPGSASGISAVVWLLCGLEVVLTSTAATPSGLRLMFLL